MDAKSVRATLRGACRHGTFFDVWIRPHPTFRAVVIVSKKVAQKAVDRNALRRKVYTLLEGMTSTPQDVVVRVKPVMGVVHDDEHKKELTSLMSVR